MTVAMKAQARWEVMDRTAVFYVGTALIVVGTLLVVSSFLALGFTGTFLGRYQYIQCLYRFRAQSKSPFTPLLSYFVSCRCSGCK